ncbi:MAG TPA: N,N-dimethylformamidase beta subunit family domain-containing protein [Candidatus Bathyarchaeia archaeon]|nr:N,N-dimethylformamidase beta subunit family domain-containing protein [Candidatus Bathyarchaeia archaeon]
MLKRTALTLVLVLVGASLGAPARTTVAAGNPIVAENQQEGSSGWRIGNSVADDTNGQIKGYTSATSVSPGQSLTFYVSVNPAQQYSIDIYRMGYYGGLGGRLRSHVAWRDGVKQSDCVPDATTGLTDCGWSPSYGFTVPSDWTSGAYVALLTNGSGYQNYVPFVVRDGRPAAFLYQVGIATDQAYNNYPNDGQTGKSLYAFNSSGPNTIGGDARAVKVSFDRPYADSGAGTFFDVDVYLIRWLERNGYDVTYSTSVDTHANGAALRNSKAFLSGGHDEYWSKEMFDAAESARDAGVNLAFFASDAVSVQIRFEPSAAGIANRVVVCYRDANLDPVQGPTTTVAWRDPPVDRPEQTLRGVQNTAYVEWGHLADYVVTNSSHWIYDGTGFKDGDVVPGIVGYEMDRFVAEMPAPNATSRTLLSHSPFTDVAGKPEYANSSIYQAPSGAWVFSSGTTFWALGLENIFSNNADPRIQRTTANLLNAFLATGGSGGTVDHLDVAAAATATAGASFNVTVTARDAQGDPVTSYSGTLHWTSSDTSAGVVLPADATLTNGQGTFPVTLTKAGAQTVTATDTQTATLTASANISVSAAAASTLALAAPSSVVMNQAFNVTVTAKDRFGNLATGYTGAVHFSTSDISPLARMPADYSFAAADAGVHTFSVTLQTPPSQSVTVTDKVATSIRGSAQIAVKLPAPAGPVAPAIPLPPQAGI